MEILLNLLLILPIIWIFYKLKDTKNPFMYVGLIVLCSIGIITTINSDPYITTGYHEDHIYETGGAEKLERVDITPIKEDLGAWKYVLVLFYLMSMLGSIVYWATEDN